MLLRTTTRWKPLKLNDGSFRVLTSLFRMHMKTKNPEPFAYTISMYVFVCIGIWTSRNEIKLKWGKLFYCICGNSVVLWNTNGENLIIKIQNCIGDNIGAFK